jgi:hypothetical protein
MVFLELKTRLKFLGKNTYVAPRFEGLLGAIRGNRACRGRRGSEDLEEARRGHEGMG